MRRTAALHEVALILLRDPEARHWSYDLGKRASVRGGVLYPMLRRLLNEGWLVDDWESQEEAVNRPPRRYYMVTATGRRCLAEMFEVILPEDRK